MQKNILNKHKAYQALSCVYSVVIKFVFAALLFFPIGALATITLSDDIGLQDFDNQLQSYEDFHHQLTVAKLVSDFDLHIWEPPHPSNTNVGFTSASYWLTTTIKNPYRTSRERVLEMQFALLDDFEVALVQNGQVLYRYRTGDKYPHSNRPLNDRYFLFPIEIPPGESRLFIRSTSKGTMNIPLKLWSQEALWETKAVSLLGQGLFFGILIVMSIYNGFLFFATRDRSYLFYVIYVLAFIAHQACVRGFVFQYVWPETLSWNDHIQDYFVIFSVLAALQFFREFLSLKVQQPHIDRLIRWLIYSWIAYAFIAPFLDKVVTVWLSSAGTFLSITVAGSGAVHLWAKGFRPAKLFLIAWMFLLSAACVYILKNWGILPSNFFTEYALQLGSVFEVCLLSFALADRITYLKRKEQDATESAIRAESEILAKKEFLSKVSHEIRTPMNGVLGMIQLLQITQLNGTQKRYADIIYRSAKVLLNVISDILDFSKMEKGKLDVQLSNTNLQELLMDIKAIFARPTAEKNIELICDLDDELPDVMRTDEVRLRQILINIISNAVKHTERGRISITITPMSGQRVNFRVSDTGSGISKQQLGIIFSETSEVEKISSEGLGLVISKQLVELFGGKMVIQSTLNEGTTIDFYLPLQQADLDLPQSTTQEPVRRSLRSYSKTILVVDDDVPSQEVVQSMLQRMGHRVSVVENGQEALAAVQDNQQSWDMIFMDCEMPQMNGFEAVQKIREWEQRQGFEKSVVVGLSAHNHPTYLKRCIQSGMQTYLVKPIEFSDLKSVMRMNTG